MKIIIHKETRLEPQISLLSPEINSSVKSQMNKLEKKAFKGWDSDQNGKLHMRVGRRQLAVKIKNHKYYPLFIPQIYKKCH